ncbi:MAG: glycosyltransferase, partial [Catalinimonas sp.]
MRIVNIVDNIRPVNVGVWRAAVVTAPELLAAHGTASSVWFPAGEPYQEDQFAGARPVPLPTLSPRAALAAVEQEGLSPADTVVVSHGMWHYPTRWGAALRAKGFRWVHVPHGMLEPWPLRQKRLKKWTYFRLLERRLIRRADVVRAVSSPERDRLARWFDHTHLIANGVPRQETDLTKPARRTVFYMGRLHHKKGVVPLVRAWQASSLATRDDYQLIVAGPDDGELPKLEAALPTGGGNVRYVGAVHGAEKERYLRMSHFFALPSHSEGLPTTVPETMQWGLVPLISEGCN